MYINFKQHTFIYDSLVNKDINKTSCMFNYLIGNQML